MQGWTGNFFFFFLHTSSNGPIINDGGHFAYQLLLPSKSYHLKLNLANWPDKRDWANLKTPVVRNCSSRQLHINTVITTASVDVNFLFIWLHLACLLGAVGVYIPFALRKWQQTKRANGYKLAYIGSVTFFCRCESALISVSGCHRFPTCASL